MIERIDAFDKEIFLWLNGWHHSALDSLMWWVSSTSLWIPLYLILIFVLLKSRNQNWPKQNLSQWLILLWSIGLAILLADQISSGFFKPFFARLRPSHTPELMSQIHLLHQPNGEIYRGGLYGFVSSHAANSFAIAVFVSSILKSKMVWIWMIFWASMVSYSRIYLGVHYPGDILGGAVIGVLSGYVSAQVYLYLEKRWVN